MALDFPSSPATGQTYTGSDGTIWKWDGTKWVSGATGGAYAPLGAVNNVGRNLIHNPLFNIAQRGAGAFNATTSGWTYSLDRWMLIAAASGDVLSHLSGAINDSDRAQIGDESAIQKLACNFSGGSGAGNACISAQFIEGVRRLAGKTVTVSFYALAGSSSLKLGVSIDQFFGNGGSPSPGTTNTGQSVTLNSTTWARYSLTFAVPSIAGKTLGTAGGDQTSLLFWHSAGSNNATRSGSVGVQSGTHLIWGVQLEVGTVATPLEKPDPRYDLSNCQRFYQTHSELISAGNTTAGGFIFDSFIFPVTMRAAPTTVYAVNGYTNASALGNNAPTASQLRTQATITASGYGFAIFALSLSSDL